MSYTKLLSDAANGIINSEFRHVFQQLLIHTKDGQHLRIALCYHSHKKHPRRYRDPIASTMESMHCSRRTLFRAYGKFKPALVLGESPVSHNGTEVTKTVLEFKQRK